VRRVGEVGSGSALKLCLNQSIGVLAAGLGESLRLGRELGLDRELLLEVLGATGYGWFLGQKRAMLDSGDFGGAVTFSVDLMAKDLRLAVEAAHGPLPVTAASASAAAAAADEASGQDYAVMTAHVADGGAVSP
jgi:3-hydroxyisobutyrate dehydrogenase